MKKTLLAAGIALTVLGGGVGAANAQVAVGISIGDRDHHRHHYRASNHYWWHGRWYDSQPAGYYYVAPPYPYAHAYWRTHWQNTGHCRDWNNDGWCDRRHRY